MDRVRITFLYSDPNAIRGGEIIQRRERRQSLGHGQVPSFHDARGFRVGEALLLRNEFVFESVAEQLVAEFCVDFPNRGFDVVDRLLQLIRLVGDLSVKILNGVVQRAVLRVHLRVDDANRALQTLDRVSDGGEDDRIDSSVYVGWRPVPLF